MRSFGDGSPKRRKGELRSSRGASWYRGKHNDACQLLAEVYGWSTEGLDTADLQEAKALLEELA